MLNSIQPPENRPQPLPPDASRQVTLAALRRPMAVIVLVIGAVAFITTQAWWLIPLTLITYASLVFLAIKDPLFQRKALNASNNNNEITAAGPGPSLQDVSPERKARWLPRGETRQKVEAALITYRQTVSAIEEADDVSRAVLEDAVPKLHSAADHLVDLALRREKAAQSIREINAPLSGSSAQDTQDGEALDHTARYQQEREANVGELQSEVEAADAQISGMVSEMLALRAKVARVSLGDSPVARATAIEVNGSLDQLNAQLDALKSTMSPPENL